MNMSKLKAFKILKVNEYDTLQTIKRSYRKLALKYHPDKNKKGTKQFLEIRQAWETLQNHVPKDRYNPPYERFVFTTDMYTL